MAVNTIGVKNGLYLPFEIETACERTAPRVEIDVEKTNKENAS